MNNMLLRGCKFSKDSRFIYTLAAENRKPAYVNKYKVCQTWDPVDTIKAHDDAGTGLVLSSNG